MQHSIKSLSILLLLVTPSFLLAYEVDQNLKAEYADRLKAMKVDKPPKLTPELESTITRIKKHVDSQEWRQQQLKYLSSLSGQDLELQDDDSKKGNRGGKYMLFISSSMPLSTLRNYAQQMEALDGAMILRGGIGGIKKIKPTMKFIKQILTVKKGCLDAKCPTFKTDVLIDPKLFTKYQITSVPALVHTTESIFDSYCERGEASLFDATQHIVYGDASLKALVGELGLITGNTEIAKTAEVLP